MTARRRWWVLGIFVLSSAINYLDRQSLATMAPPLRAEFHLSYEQYGLILTAFSIAYAACAPFAGLLIDRIGLDRAIMLAVALWSMAGIATGFTTGLASLIVCRAVLGLAEAAGIPAAGKAIHQYLPPRRTRARQCRESDRREPGPGARAARGHLDRGAPRLARGLHRHRNSRPAVDPAVEPCVALGPARRRRKNRSGAGSEHSAQPAPVGVRARQCAQHGRLFILDQFHGFLLGGRASSFAGEAARYAWIPFAFAALGGFAGGWLSLRCISAAACGRGGAHAGLPLAARGLA